jgi:hypothetical protein
VRRVALAALLATAVGGCGSSGGEFTTDQPSGATLQWNFTQSHLVTDAPGFDNGRDAQDLQPIESLSIRFPGETTLEEGGAVVRRVAPSRSGSEVTRVVVASQPQSEGSAHALASRWAKAFGVPHRIGTGGPIPSVTIGPSSGADKPFLVTLTFTWPRG